MPQICNCFTCCWCLGNMTNNISRKENDSSDEALNMSLKQLKMP